MAKVIHGGGAQMSGSVGASTYTRNGLVRRRTNPRNTITSRRSEMQGNLSTFAAQFRTLTPSERATWLGALTRVNSLGAVITLSPIAAFVATNCALAAAGKPVVSVAPAFAPATLLSIVGLSIEGDDVLADQVMNLAVSNASGAPRDVIVEATAPMSPGIGNFLTSLRYIGTYSPDDGDSSIAVKPGYVAVFGEMALSHGNIGLKVGVRVRDLNLGNPLPVGIIGQTVLDHV